MVGYYKQGEDECLQILHIKSRLVSSCLDSQVGILQRTSSCNRTSQISTRWHCI